MATTTVVIPAGQLSIETNAFFGWLDASPIVLIDSFPRWTHITVSGTQQNDGVHLVSGVVLPHQLRISGGLINEGVVNNQVTITREDQLIVTTGSGRIINNTTYSTIKTNYADLDFNLIFSAGQLISVSGSSFNDGNYQIISITEDELNQSEINVQELLVDEDPTTTEITLALVPISPTLEEVEFTLKTADTMAFTSQVSTMLPFTSQVATRIDKTLATATEINFTGVV